MARSGRSAWRNNVRYVVASGFACFLLLLRCLFLVLFLVSAPLGSSCVSSVRGDAGGYLLFLVFWLFGDFCVSSARGNAGGYVLFLVSAPLKDSCVYSVRGNAGGYLLFLVFSLSFGSLANFASPPLVVTPEAMSFSWCRRPSRTLAFLTFLPSPMAPFSDSALCCHGYLHFFITPLLLYVQLPFSLCDIC